MNSISKIREYYDSVIDNRRNKTGARFDGGTFDNDKEFMAIAAKVEFKLDWVGPDMFFIYSYLDNRNKIRPVEIRITLADGSIITADIKTENTVWANKDSLNSNDWEPRLKNIRVNGKRVSSIKNEDAIGGFVVSHLFEVEDQWA